MNANFFALKRAFHGTLRITRASLARLGLTAARFDLLHAPPRTAVRDAFGDIATLYSPWHPDD